MYWPIGAPKTYAASKHIVSSRSTRLIASNDGLETEAIAEQDGDHLGDEQRGVISNGQPLPTSASTTPSSSSHDIIDLKIARAGHIFASITESSLSVWQTKPTALLATVIRSDRSLNTYGSNTSISLRPDALMVIVETKNGFLIAYTLSTDPPRRVYQLQNHNSLGSHARRQSSDAFRRQSVASGAGPGEGEGIWEVGIRFCMVIRIDAGISKCLVLDEELIVSTVKPAAVQCIRWPFDSTASSHSTELVKRMLWMSEKVPVIDMSYDRPMNLYTWITDDGKVYAVQRLLGANADPSNPKSLFKGFCFHLPSNESEHATKAAINARFSLVAVACADSSVRIYAAKDYSGNIPLSHNLQLPVSNDSSGKITYMSYSPDGYCLFVGFEKGWAMWSVYGKPGANTFGADRSMIENTKERWLDGVKTGFWIGAGSEILLLGSESSQFSVLEMARSSATGCFVMPNITRSLLQGSTSFMMYKGLDATDATTISGETSLWQTVQIPQNYLAVQWPIRLSVVSPDGRYVAVAGRRGLAHYSVGSGRWKNFDDPRQEDSFTVRGGMCWWQHILVAAVESGSSYEVRLYSREKSLDASQVLHAETQTYPIVCIATSGEDSLLVYTYENILLHYIFDTSAKSVKLAQVGRIAFPGIIRAPPRVRAISWILPEHQREHGDPSQDVATAAVIFLVDAKLVLLQPSANEYGELKYDMRVIAHDVEFYTLTREQMVSSTTHVDQNSQFGNGNEALNGIVSQGIRDSLWYFNGTSVHVWPEIIDVLKAAPTELEREIPTPVMIPTDFYPLSAMVEKGIVAGIEPDLVQRRDVDFSFYRLASRTHLFIPAILRHHLAHYDSAAALHLSHFYQKLPYFSHSLEILLHDVLDDEVDASPHATETALLPSVISFLSSFPTYYDIVAGCTRKTEMRSWRTLFSCLPPVQTLFEESLARGLLKTAGSYLLILHSFDEEHFNTEQIATLLRRAKDVGDWDLCRELARFLVGIDDSGHLLKTVIASAGLRSGGRDDGASPSVNRSNGSLGHASSNGVGDRDGYFA